MGYTSTGDASESQAWNPYSQFVGKIKVGGGEIGIPPMPAYEGDLVAIRSMQVEDMHKLLHAMMERLHMMTYYADPMVKFVPITLDPAVEYIVRLDGRWHVSIWIAAAGNILVQFPGMGAATIAAVAGWNVLTCPDGTKIYSGTGRVPAYIRYANRGIAA